MFTGCRYHGETVGDPSKPGPSKSGPLESVPLLFTPVICVKTAQRIITEPSPDLHLHIHLELSVLRAACCLLCAAAVFRYPLLFAAVSLCFSCPVGLSHLTDNRCRIVCKLLLYIICFLFVQHLR